MEEYISDVDFSQIIHVRSFQFESLSDNNDGIESFESEVLGTRSDIEEIPNRLINTD